MDILDKIDGALNEATIEVFDDVKDKKTNKTFKVVELETGTVRLSPTGEKNPKEFNVDRKTFNKNYIVV